ncbi:MAG: tRNA uridine-5-carboxymethylaminomethyl(34) synthesis GTPase MnmE [Hyphomicrobiaceae bacterium]
MSSASTIYALSSGQGPAAIAVIRISGPRAVDALLALTGSVPEPRRAALRRLSRPIRGTLLDEALVLYFKAPHSETGEDLVELHAHGGRAVVSAILAELAKLEGYRLAEPGEFVRRAFEAGKLDLVGIEGLADLINAETEAQREQAIRQAAGEPSRLYESWRQNLLEALALAEASLDFAEEADVAADAYARAISVARPIHDEMRDRLADDHRGEILREGFRVVLAGPPNAGKSSLLNALARRDVAIVSPEAGTTRDALEVRLDLGGYPVIVTDTAGLREPEGAIEAEGIRRSLGHMRQAQMVLWLVESTGGTVEPPVGVQAIGAPIRPIITKGDLVCRPVPGMMPDTLRVSARTGRGLSELIHEIGEAASKALATGSTAIITRERHRLALEEMVAGLADFQASDPSRPELGVEELRRSVIALGRLTGRIDVEDVLGVIFGSFCIGK